MGHEVEDFQVYHWKIDSWRALKERTNSPEFEAGGWKWYEGLILFQAQDLSLKSTRVL